MAFQRGKDKTLFQQLKKKDKEAFTQAYDLYLENIYRFIYFKVSNREEAEDLTSQTFLKTWDYIQNNNLDEYKNLKSLLYKVARNAVIDHYRKKSQQQNISYEDGFSQIDIIDERQDLNQQIELSADWSKLEKVMFELKDEYREIIILKYVNELSIPEISEILDKSRGNVRVMIFRALAALRDLINKKTTASK
jgi:RNA polymerase sigma-70 factor (ECF subfamily)